MQLVALFLFWAVLLELFLALNIWLGTLAYGWYQQRKKRLASLKED